MTNSALNANSPNILFVICDDLNNAVASMGRRPFAPAPNVQRLIDRGVSFRNAHSNCPVCLPSRCSMLSGLYPHTTGHYTLWDSWRTQTFITSSACYGREYRDVPLLGDAVMMPQHFKNNGYAVFGAGKIAHEGETDPAWWTEYGNGTDYGPMIWDAARSRLAAHPDRCWMFEGEPLQAYAERYDGLDRFFAHEHKFRTHIEMQFGSLPEILGTPGIDVRNGSPGNAPYRYVNDEDRDPLPDERTAAWAVDILRRKHDNPFFLGVGFMKPHTPLNAPQRFHDMFPPDELELPPILENDCDDCARAHVEHRPYGFLAYDLIYKGGEAMYRKWLQAYLACTAFMDEQLGKILDALEASPYRDNTIVVFTSDNAYHMGEKSFIFKDTLWEEACQVPLIVSLPAGSSKVCRAPVSLIDIYPTLNDFCSLPSDPHATSHGHPLEGHSLRPLIEDPAQGGWSGPSVALSSVRGDTGIHHAVRSERYRYVLCGNGEEELYDHQVDPHEWHNRAADPGLAEVKAGLRSDMTALLWPRKENC